MNEPVIGKITQLTNSTPLKVLPQFKSNLFSTQKPTNPEETFNINPSNSNSPVFNVVTFLAQFFCRLYGWLSLGKKIKVTIGYDPKSDPKERISVTFSSND